MQLKQSKKEARDLDLVVLDGIDEIKGLNFVSIETPSDYDVGLWGGELARVYPDYCVFNTKELGIESQAMDISLDEYFSDISKLADTIKLEKGWKK